MKISRLNIILKPRITKKFRKGFYKYLRSLSYAEFEQMFMYYNTVFFRLLSLYSKRKKKLLSKNWIKEKIIYLKKNKLYNIFIDANPEFMVILNENLKEENNRKEKIIEEIRTLEKFVKRIFSMEFIINMPPTQEDKIKIISLFMFSIEIESKMKKLSEELNKIK